TELPDHVEHGLLLRLRRRDDHSSDGQRLDPPLPQSLDEDLGWWLDKNPLGAGSWIEQHGAVLRDDSIEDVDVAADALEIAELAPGHENQASAGVLQSAERRKGLGRHDTAVRERAVVVGGERDEVHAVAPSAVIAPSR